MRETWFFGIRVFDYHFIRVVDGDGGRMEEFDERVRSWVRGRLQMVASRVGED